MSPAGVSLAPHPFWLDGGYDFESVQACPHHPNHEWVTVRLGDVLRPEALHGNEDELMTFCKGCFVPRCGTTGDSDRCKLWRHHQTAHVGESGRVEAMGSALTGSS
jgi:hypothetical protein